MIYLALEASTLVPFSLIPLALIIVVGSGIVVVRRLREAEGGIAIRWLLLIAAFFLIALGSVLASTPVSANDPSGQCGASAAEAANLPDDRTSNVSGDSCRTLGMREMTNAYGALGLGVLLALGTLAATKREPF